MINIYCKKTKRCVFVVLGLFIIALLQSSKSLAQSQPCFSIDPAGNRTSGYKTCTTDADCVSGVGGGLTVVCLLGSVCNTKTNRCESPLGEAKIINNKIAGGYDLTGSGLKALINNVIFGVGAVVGLIFFAILIMGAIAYMTAGGDEKALTKAKQQLTAGFIGLLIVFMAWWIVKIISVVFGFNLLQPNFSGP